MSGRNLTFLVIVVLGLFVATNALYVIKETERGVLLRFGEVVDPDLKPGLHVKVPFVNNVRKFEGRVLTVDSQPERFFTQEQKALIVDSYAKYRIADTAKFYTATNGEESRAAGLLSQRVNDGLRNQVAIRTIQEVVSGERDQLMDVIKKELDVVAREELGVEVVDVRVKQIGLRSDLVLKNELREFQAEYKQSLTQDVPTLSGASAPPSSVCGSTQSSLRCRDARLLRPRHSRVRSRQSAIP